MPTLKQYIEQVALRLGSRGSRIASTGIDIEVPAAGNSVAYVAPADGVITYTGRTAGDAYGGAHISRQSSKQIAAGIDCGGTLWAWNSLPVARGEVFQIASKGNWSMLGLSFIPSVGGA